MTRRYIDGWHGTITAAEARKKYPDPLFFDRPNLRMSEDELKAMLMHRATEMEMWCQRFKSLAAGNYAGSRRRKKDWMAEINLLHDWHNSLNVTGGNFGQPFLWEE